MLSPQANSLTRQAVTYFCERYSSPLSRQEVAKSLGVTAGYLTSVFRKDLGITPWEYLTRRASPTPRSCWLTTAKAP